MSIIITKEVGKYMDWWTNIIKGPRLTNTQYDKVIERFNEHYKELTNDRKQFDHLPECNPGHEKRQSDGDKEYTWEEARFHISNLLGPNNSGRV